MLKYFICVFHASALHKKIYTECVSLRVLFVWKSLWHNICYIYN